MGRKTEEIKDWRIKDKKDKVWETQKIKEPRHRKVNLMSRDTVPRDFYWIKFQSQAVNTQDKDYKSIEKEIIRNEKRIGT